MRLVAYLYRNVAFQFLKLPSYITEILLHVSLQKLTCTYIMNRNQESTNIPQGIFSRSTNFANVLKKKVQGNHFHDSTLVSSLQFAIRVMIELPLIFSKTNFVEVPKIHEICEICSPCPTVSYIAPLPYRQPSEINT